MTDPQPHAAGHAGLLGAACLVFDHILGVLRGAEAGAGGLLPAFAMAAAAAADGRDAVLAAAPAPAGPRGALPPVPAFATAEAAADYAAGLAAALRARLGGAPAAGPADRAACAAAADCAARVWEALEPPSAG